jgi:hypothetical protein
MIDSLDHKETKENKGRVQSSLQEAEREGQEVEMRKSRNHAIT